MFFLKDAEVSLETKRHNNDEKKCLAYNKKVERLIKSEYSMLKDVTYLDHGGTTLASRTLMKSFFNHMQSTLLFNPHSDSSSPSASALIIQKTREQVLQLFHADPDHFDVIFTANATAAVKLVMDCFSGHTNGFDYCYHRNCHTSLVGVREQAQQSLYLETDEDVHQWLKRGSSAFELDPCDRPVLFAYPAQSNMNGERLPLHWPGHIRASSCHPNTFTLLDVAALVSTSPFSLSCPEEAPDFTVMSFYKIFGFPDLGALIVRKDSAHMLTHRKYFGGGTTEMIICGNKSWVAPKTSSIHARLEDGTVAIRSILALSCAIDCHPKLFGGLEQVSKHTTWLASIVYEELDAMRHANGTPVCLIYKAPNSTYGDSQTQGATITFNICNADGSWKSNFNAGALLRSKNVHVRAGSLCNPGGTAHVLNLSAEAIRRAYDSGFRCNQPNDIRAGVPFGMIRVTLGATSTLKDVRTFLKVMRESFVEQDVESGLHPFWRKRHHPIKSHGNVTGGVYLHVDHLVYTAFAN